MKTLVMTDHRSGAKLARKVRAKGIGDGRICQVIFEWLQDLGYGTIIMKSDGN